MLLFPFQCSFPFQFHFNFTPVSQFPSHVSPPFLSNLYSCCVLHIATLCIVTLCIVTLCIVTLCIVTLCIVTLYVVHCVLYFVFPSLAQSVVLSSPRVTTVTPQYNQNITIITRNNTFYTNHRMCIADYRTYNHR